jgi:hypothetical protein
LNKLFQQYKIEGDFPMEDLRQLAKKDRHSIFSALTYLRRLQRLGVFAPRSTPLSKMAWGL